MLASSWAKGKDARAAAVECSNLAEGKKRVLLSYKLDQALYQKALGAGGLEVFATSAALEEVIDAVRRSAATEE